MKLGDLGLAKTVDTTRSFLESNSRISDFFAAPEVHSFGEYSPASDVYMWAVSMCMVAIDAVGGSSEGLLQGHIIARGVREVERLAPDVGRLLTACLDPDRHRRPCCTQARDRVLAAAGVWPALGAWRGCVGRVRVGL